jgi:hypothetical protein
MVFSDSSQFQLDEFGVMRHKRVGNTWVDKLMDGVNIDTTMFFENCGYCYIEEDPGEEVVGERKTTSEIKETEKAWNHQKEDKSKKKTKKKTKRYQTKPKPKSSWHKRISKIANELDMEAVFSHTEEKAVQEIGDFYDNYFEEKRLQEKQKEMEYWNAWEKRVNENPGEYGIISLKVLKDQDGVSVHDIDQGGVKRDNMFDIYNEGRAGHYAMKEWDILPSVVREDVWQGPRGTLVDQGFSFKTYNFFTYWDEKNHMYIWKSMDNHSWQCGGWRDHFDYYPAPWGDLCLEDIFSLDKQWLPFKEVGTLSRWINGIEWETIWSRMDEMRTGVFGGGRRIWEGGDGFMNRSREANHYIRTQIPRMIFLR